MDMIVSGPKDSGKGVVWADVGGLDKTPWMPSDLSCPTIRAQVGGSLRGGCLELTLS
jgi:hypothetical protein